MNLLDNMGFVVDKSQLKGRKNRNYLVGSMYLWLIQFMGWCRPSKLRILVRNATLLILVCWNLDDHQTQSMLVSAVSVVDICDFTAVQPVALGARLWAKLIILSALGKSGHFNKWYRNRSREHFIQRNVVFIILDALHMVNSFHVAISCTINFTTGETMCALFKSYRILRIAITKAQFFISITLTLIIANKAQVAA